MVEPRSEDPEFKPGGYRKIPLETAKRISKAVNATAEQEKFDDIQADIVEKRAAKAERGGPVSPVHPDEVALKEGRISQEQFDRRQEKRNYPPTDQDQELLS